MQINKILGFVTMHVFSKGYLWLLISCFTLASCGFQLRGTGTFDFDSIYIQSEASNRVTSEVKRLLSEQNIKITVVPKEAQVLLYLRHEGIKHRMLSVSAISGKLEEIEINLHVDMEATQTDGSSLLENRTLKLMRDYSFDENAVLAVGSEQEIIQKEMFRDIVAQVMRRLQIIKMPKK